jgi:hypothetical protein
MMPSRSLSHGTSLRRVPWDKAGQGLICIGWDKWDARDKWDRGDRTSTQKGKRTGPVHKLSFLQIDVLR